jgi:hypothetical protein
MTVTTSSFVQHKHFCPVNHASIFSRNSYKTKISRKSYIGNFWQIQGSIRILYRGFQKNFCIGGHAPRASLPPSVTATIAWSGHASMKHSIHQVPTEKNDTPSIPFTRYAKGDDIPDIPNKRCAECLNGMHITFPRVTVSWSSHHTMHTRVPSLLPKEGCHAREPNNIGMTRDRLQWMNRLHKTTHFVSTWPIVHSVWNSLSYIVISTYV